MEKQQRQVSLKKNNNETGKITLKVDGKSGDRCPSPVTKIGGFKWHLILCKLPDKSGPWKSLEASICCDLDNTGPVEKLWMCKAEIRLFMRTFDESKTFQIFFFNGRTSQSYKFTELDWGFNEPVFTAEMNVLLDYDNLSLSMPTLETDLQLLFNGKTERMAVNKFALASVSSYFHNLFFGNWSERAEESSSSEFSEPISVKEDPDFDLAAFKLMLYSAMVMGWTVQEGKFLQSQSAMAILKLSIKYDVPMLQSYCQKYLLASTDTPRLELLELADQLGIQELKDHCLATISAADVLMKFSHNIDICANLGKRTRKELDERMAESAKKLCTRPVTPPAALNANVGGLQQAAVAALAQANAPNPAGANANEQQQQRNNRDPRVRAVPFDMVIRQVQAAPVADLAANRGNQVEEAAAARLQAPVAVPIINWAVDQPIRAAERALPANAYQAFQAHRAEQRREANRSRERHFWDDFEAANARIAAREEEEE